jgi:hypothetical protein
MGVKRAFRPLIDKLIGRGSPDVLKLIGRVSHVRGSVSKLIGRAMALGRWHGFQGL